MSVFSPYSPDIPKNSRLSVYLFYFFVCSIGGFIWEVLIFLWKDGVFCKRGFFYGPWLPIYGTGAVLMYLVLHALYRKPFLVFLISATMGSLLELLIGWFLNTCFHLRYWNYSDYFWNLKGYICLWSMLGFGISGTLWVCWLSGRLSLVWQKLSRSLQRAINTLLLLLFFLDVAAALIFPNSGMDITF